MVNLSIAAEKVAALSIAALRGSLEPFDPRVHARRTDASQQRVAERLWDLLDGADWEPSRIQDPFALRTIPQVHAPFVDALSTLVESVLIEVNDPTENPMVGDDGRPMHHGGFMTARLSATLDALRQASYPVLALSAARLSHLLNPSLTGPPGVPRERPTRQAPASWSWSTSPRTPSRGVACSRPRCRPATSRSHWGSRSVRASPPRRPGPANG